MHIPERCGVSVLSVSSRILALVQRRGDHATFWHTGVQRRCICCQTSSPPRHRLCPPYALQWFAPRRAFSYFRMQRAHFPGSRETFEMLLAKSQLCVAFRSSCGSLTIIMFVFPFFSLRRPYGHQGNRIHTDGCGAQHVQEVRAGCYPIPGADGRRHSANHL